MSECEGSDCKDLSHSDVPLVENTTPVPEVVKEAPKVPKIQTLIITLADGRRGVFAGPELITATEMLLRVIPRIVHVDFLPARDLQKPEPKEAAPKPTEEAQSGNQNNSEEKETLGLGG